MPLKLVTGGTTGARDGTLVSAGNKLTIAVMNTPIDLHVRCDDGFWSDTQDCDLPANVEISFNGGSTWKTNLDEPIRITTGNGLAGTDVWDVNYPVKVRQVMAAAAVDADLVTDGTYTATAALSTPTLTVTPGDTQNALSWTNVANEDASPGYTVEWSADGSTGWTALTTTAQNVTTYTHTGLTNGVARYYRVKAEGSGRYSDSGWGTGNGTPASSVVGADTFADTNGVNLESHTPTGTGATGSWTQVFGSGDKLQIRGNRLGVYRSSTGAATAEYEYSVTPNANCAAQCDVYVSSIVADSLVLLRVRSTAFAGNYYAGYLYYTGGVWTFYLRRNGQTPVTATISAPSVGSTHTLKVEAIGSAIKLYWDGVEQCALTDSVITAAGKTDIQISCGTAVSTADAGLMVDNFQLLNA